MYSLNRTKLSLCLIAVIALGFDGYMPRDVFAAMPGNTRVSCPNRDAMPNPEPRQPKCGEGGGGGGGGASMGGSGTGPTNCDSEASKGGSGSGSAAGDPISISHGYVLSDMTDFSIPVKWGLSLGVRRLYSSTGWGFTTSNNNGQGMFGVRWFCSLETRLEATGFDQYSEPTGFFYVDEEGIGHHFYNMYPAEPNVFWSRVDQGQRMKLTKTGTGTSAVYTVLGADGTERTFNADGRILTYEADVDTVVQERLTFVYDGSGRLYQLQAPSGDDRYIEFTYHVGTNLVSQAELKTATQTYLLKTYYYNPQSFLSDVQGNSNVADVHLTHYRYGSWHPTGGGSPVWSWGDRLGEVSYTIEGESTPRPLAAYDYLVNGTGSPCAGTQYNWDSEDAQIWATAFHIEDVIYSGTGNSLTVGMPGGGETFVHTNYDCDITDMSYGGTVGSDAQMPAPHIFKIPGYTPPVVCGNDLAVPRAPASSERQVSDTEFIPLWEFEYDLTNTDPLLQFRILEFNKYTTDNPNSVLTTSYTYGDVNHFPRKVSTVTNPAGETVGYTYYYPDDAPYACWIGKPASITRGGLITAFTYDTSTGRLQTVTDPWNKTTTYGYNDRGDVTSVTYPDNEVVTRTYNDFSQVLTETRTNMGTTTYVYSNQSDYTNNNPIPAAYFHLPPRLLETRDPLGHSTYYAYDSSGDVTTITDANGKSVDFVYDDRGRITQKTNHNNESVYYGYDAAENMVAFTDARNKTTTYDYDRFGRVWKTTDPDGKYVQYDYTDETVGGGGGGCSSCGGAGANLIARLRKQDGTYVSFRYDLAGQLVAIDFEDVGETDSEEVTFIYDDAGRMVQCADTRIGDDRYAYFYDTGDTGRLEMIYHPGGYTQEFFYQDDPEEDNYRRLVAYKDTDGNVVNYVYDTDGRLWKVVDAYGAETVYTYATTSDTGFPVGSIKRIAYGNGAKQDYTYDGDGRLDRIDFLGIGGAAFDYIDLARDPVGMITGRERKDGASYLTAEYDYDNAYRLEEERYFDDVANLKSLRHYDYDAGGNRTGLTLWNSDSVNKSTTFTYGNRSQLLTSTGYCHEGTQDTGAITYAFDDKGNMTGRTSASAVDWTYDWNESNRLTQAASSEGNVVDFTYDTFGRRILKKVNNAARTRYFFNGLTEEIKKQSVAGAYGSGAAGQTVYKSTGDSYSNWHCYDPYPSGGSVSVFQDDVPSEVPDPSYSNVLHFTGQTLNFTPGAYVFGNGWLLGEGARAWCQNNPTDVSWADADHDLIGWKFKTTQPALFYVIVGCSGGEERYLAYKTGSGSDYIGCRYLVINLGDGLTDGTWHLIERNVQTDLARLIPGLTVTQIRGFAVRAGDLYFDDLRLGPAGDEAFDFVSRLDGTKTASQWTNETYVSSVYDTARRSDVIKIAATHWVIHGLNHYLGGTWDYNVSGARTLSAWVKSTSGPEFIVSVETTAGLRPLRYQWNGTPTAAPYAWTGATPNVPLFGCGFTADGLWHRLERNLAADAAAAYPGETLLRVRGMTFNAYTQDLYLDDVRLSNAMTVEHNTMGPGVVGHILRVTQTDPTTYAQAHRWLHYDQVGSVLSESDATGNFIQRHEQDTFGNTLASWQTGLIGGDRTGWHHNTKEWDGDVGLVYMVNRYYLPETSSFASAAPRAPMNESPYGFAAQNPVLYLDPKGRSVTYCGVAGGGSAFGAGLGYNLGLGYDPLSEEVVLYLTLQAGGSPSAPAYGFSPYGLDLGYSGAPSIDEWVGWGGYGGCGGGAGVFAQFGYTNSSGYGGFDFQLGPGAGFSMGGQASYCVPLLRRRLAPDPWPVWMSPRPSAPGPGGVMCEDDNYGGTLIMRDPAHGW